MYLIILENGTMYTTNNISEDDLNHADDGYMSILNITDSNNVTDYYDSEWVKTDHHD